MNKILLICTFSIFSVTQAQVPISEEFATQRPPAIFVPREFQSGINQEKITDFEFTNLDCEDRDSVRNILEKFDRLNNLEQKEAEKILFVKLREMGHQLFRPQQANDYLRLFQQEYFHKYRPEIQNIADYIKFYQEEIKKPFPFSDMSHEERETQSQRLANILSRKRLRDE